MGRLLPIDTCERDASPTTRMITTPVVRQRAFSDGHRTKLAAHRSAREFFGSKAARKGTKAPEHSGVRFCLNWWAVQESNLRPMDLKVAEIDEPARFDTSESKR
jgi:hypothetical protein